MTFEPSATAFPYLVAKAWDVNEETTTAYLRGNINTEWGDVNVRGNVGVHIQRVDQSSDAIRLSNGGNPQPIHLGKTITDVLPSMNLVFGLANDQTLRLAFAKQVARPRVDQPRASLEVTASDAVNVETGLRDSFANGGNPTLDPWRADAFDISYEKYFGTRAYIAAAYFYKDLKSYIYTQDDPFYDLSEYTGSFAPIAGVEVNPIGKLTTPQNGEGGMLQGLELTGSSPFDMFSDTLSGFGVVASATFNDSDIKNPRPGKRLQRGQRRHRPAWPVQAHLQPHGLLRKEWFRSAYQPAPSFGLHRRNRQLQRQPHPALRRWRKHHRCAGQLYLQRRKLAQRPVSAAAGQQPDQRGLSHLRRQQGPSAGIHRMGPELPAGADLQVLIRNWREEKGCGKPQPFFVVLVERRGIEPLTSTMRTWRSPS